MREAAPLELGADGRANLKFAFGQLRLFRGPAGSEIRSELAFLGPAVDGARDLSVDQDNALVAISHGGKERLGDERLFPDGAEEFR